MIDLSVTAGYVLAPPKRWQGPCATASPRLLNYLPPVKRYFLEMRFKPMPQYREGALLTDCAGKTSPVGKMFIQPQVTLESGESVLLDEVIGANFAIIGWGCNPQWGLDAGQIARWRAIGVRFIRWCRRCRSTASRITPRHAAGGRQAKSPEELVCSA